MKHKNKKSLNMDLGIGTDIESISRFRKLKSDKDQSFLNGIYTNSELDYCLSKKSFGPHLAVRFSAKEAVIKALCSIGYNENVSYKQIEIFLDNNNVPNVKLHKNNLKNVQVKLSLSHSKTHAVAFAIASTI